MYEIQSQLPRSSEYAEEKRTEQNLIVRSVKSHRPTRQAFSSKLTHESRRSADRTDKANVVFSIFYYYYYY